MTNNTWIDFGARIALMLPAFLISISFHEFSHALVAYLLGDNTAKRQGRLTLNPIAHVDFMGLLFLLIFRIGWAKPVPLNYRNFKCPRIYAVLTALAGPVSNFLLAFASFELLKHFPEAWFAPIVAVTIMQILTATAYINIMLGVFNILPIPPLDGSHIMTALLINYFPSVVSWYERYSLVILILLFMLPPMRELLFSLIMYTHALIQSFVF